MKAVLCREFGPVDNLAWENTEPPACGPRQVRYRTTVATLGFMDTLMARGWESKAIESQQADREATAAAKARGPVSPEEAARAAKRQTCEMA